MVWFGMVFNISLGTPFAIIDYHSEITCNIPILNVVAIWSTSSHSATDEGSVRLPKSLAHFKTRHREVKLIFFTM